MGKNISDEDDRGPLGVNVVVDEDICEPLSVTLFNHRTNAPFQIKEGDQIAILICESIVCPQLTKVSHLNNKGSNPNFQKEQNTTQLIWRL
jgi:dUTPase